MLEIMLRPLIRPNGEEIPRRCDGDLCFEPPVGILWPTDLFRVNLLAHHVENIPHFSGKAICFKHLNYVRLTLEHING
jgi:hypothetical protein